MRAKGPASRVRSSSIGDEAPRDSSVKIRGGMSLDDEVRRLQAWEETLLASLRIRRPGKFPKTARDRWNSGRDPSKSHHGYVGSSRQLRALRESPLGVPGRKEKQINELEKPSCVAQRSSQRLRGRVAHA